jgi:hypothetical protein
MEDFLNIRSPKLECNRNKRAPDPRSMAQGKTLYPRDNQLSRSDPNLPPSARKLRGGIAEERVLV